MRTLEDNEFIVPSDSQHLDTFLHTHFIAEEMENASILEYSPATQHKGTWYRLKLKSEMN